MQIVLHDKQSKAFNLLADKNSDVSTLFYGGAIRGGKSWLAWIMLIVLCDYYPNSRWLVCRSVYPRIKDSVLPSFKSYLSSIGLKHNFSGNPINYNHPNGSVIMFRAENYAQDKTHEWLRGMEINGGVIDEVTETQESFYKKILERCGTHQNLERIPKAILLCTCNPSFNWVKTEIRDKFINKELDSSIYFLQANSEDNPSIPDSLKLHWKKTMGKYAYDVMVRGNWDIKIQSGDEFLADFNLERNTSNFINLDITKPVHISFDENVKPYIGITLWQIDVDKKEIYQVDELQQRSPHNTASKAGKQVVTYLNKAGFRDKVFLYGDPSANKRNAISDYSFTELFEQELNKFFTVDNKMAKKAPSVALSAEFVNKLFRHEFEWKLLISERCKESISDYLEVKKDVNGAMHKRKVKDSDGVMYEEHGHLTDTLRYFLCQALPKEFNTINKKGNGILSMGLGSQVYNPRAK